MDRRSAWKDVIKQNRIWKFPSAVLFYAVCRFYITSKDFAKKVKKNGSPVQNQLSANTIINTVATKDNKANIPYKPLFFVVSLIFFQVCFKIYNKSKKAFLQ